MNPVLAVGLALVVIGVFAAILGLLWPATDSDRAHAERLRAEQDIMDATTTHDRSQP